MAKKTAAKKKKKEVCTDKLVHILVPQHEKLNDKEKQALFTDYKITLKELPKISEKDPGIRHLEPKAGDVIKITRVSELSGKTVYYRGVINA